MVIIFADDGTVFLAGDLSSVQRECEPIDVEEKVYRFYDPSGHALRPRWVVPNRRRRILGLFDSVTPGTFELVRDPDPSADEFRAELQRVLAMAPNPWFNDLASFRLQFGIGEAL
jgi:hypothetical protein